MRAKVESYINLLDKKDSGVKLRFDDISDQQLIYFCMDEELIDEEIAYLYNTTTDDVKRRRHRAYLNQLHRLQDKVLQDHFVVVSRDAEKSDIRYIESDKVKDLLEQIHKLSNSELDQLLDYIILNNKRLSATITRSKE